MSGFGREVESTFACGETGSEGQEASSSPTQLWEGSGRGILLRLGYLGLAEARGNGPDVLVGRAATSADEGGAERAQSGGGLGHRFGCLRE